MEQPPRLRPVRHHPDANEPRIDALTIVDVVVPCVSRRQTTPTWDPPPPPSPPTSVLSVADRSRLGSFSPGLFSSLKRRKSKQDLLEGTHTKAADMLQQATRRFLAKKRAREAKQAEEEAATAAAEEEKRKQYEALKAEEYKALNEKALKEEAEEKAEDAAMSSAEEAATSSPTPNVLVAASNTVFALWTVVTAVLRAWVAFIVVRTACLHITDREYDRPSPSNPTPPHRPRRRHRRLSLHSAARSTATSESKATCPRPPGVMSPGWLD